jgi:hypothetical protein
VSLETGERVGLSGRCRLPAPRADDDSGAAGRRAVEEGEEAAAARRA